MVIRLMFSVQVSRGSDGILPQVELECQQDEKPLKGGWTFTEVNAASSFFLSEFVATF